MLHALYWHVSCWTSEMLEHHTDSLISSADPDTWDWAAFTSSFIWVPQLCSESLKIWQ